MLSLAIVNIMVSADSMNDRAFPTESPQVEEMHLALEQLGQAKATALLEAHNAQQASQEALAFTNEKFANIQVSKGQREKPTCLQGGKVLQCKTVYLSIFPSLLQLDRLFVQLVETNGLEKKVIAWLPQLCDC
jgi:hypothetical protein